MTWHPTHPTDAGVFTALEGGLILRAILGSPVYDSVNGEKEGVEDLSAFFFFFSQLSGVGRSENASALLFPFTSGLRFLQGSGCPCLR